MKYVSVRSPFWQILAATLSLSLIASFIASNPASSNGSVDVMRLNFSIIFLVILACAIISQIVYAILLQVYNKAHPNQKVKYFSDIPPEVIDSDERAASIMGKATRRVYIYHTYALAVFAAILIAQPPLLAIVGILYVLILGHYLVYWHGIMPLIED